MSDELKKAAIALNAVGMPCFVLLFILSGAFGIFVAAILQIAVSITTLLWSLSHDHEKVTKGQGSLVVCTIVNFLALLAAIVLLILMVVGTIRGESLAYLMVLLVALICPAINLINISILFAVKTNEQQEHVTWKAKDNV